MDHEYDLAVIGTGTAAQGVAGRVRAAGWSVAVVDHRPFGGTCALRGCDPKKMLLGGASAVDHARRMRGKGVEGDARVDWPELMSFKRSFTDPVPRHNEERFAKKGIEAFHGRARFASPNEIDVEGEAGTTRLRARRILVASGAEPVRLGIPGEEHLADSEAFLALEALPPRVALVGGGYIAAEFSRVAAAAGARVTILQHGARMLKNFDPDVVGWLMQAFRERSVDVRLDFDVERVEKVDGAYRVHGRSGGQAAFVDADLVVHAAGRAPRLDELRLDAAAVEIEGGKIRLNEFLQSVSNPAVYAAGDAAQSGPPLTPVSSHHAKVVAANLLEGNHARPDYRGVPSVAFSEPPIASVGLGEQEARAKGLRFKVNSASTPQWFTARQAAQSVYGHKVLVEEGTGAILGAHLVGPGVDETINIFALAIRHGLTADALKSSMFAYPTGASDVGYML